MTDEDAIAKITKKLGEYEYRFNKIEENLERLSNNVKEMSEIQKQTIIAQSEMVSNMKNVQTMLIEFVHKADELTASMKMTEEAINVVLDEVKEMKTVYKETSDKLLNTFLNSYKKEHNTLKKEIKWKNKIIAEFIKYVLLMLAMFGGVKLATMI